MPMLSLHGLTIYSGLLLAGGGLLLMLTFGAMRLHQYPVGYWFGWLCLSGTIYIVGYAIELACQTPTQAAVCIAIELTGGMFTPGLLILMALAYRFQRHPPPVLIAALLGFACLLVAILYGNSLHHLMFSSIAIEQRHGLTISMLVPGPWFYLHLMNINASVIISSALFWQCWRRAPAHHRPQVLLILLGCLPPWICFLCYLADWSPDGVDLSAFGFLLTAPLFALGLWRYRFADILPLARTQVFDVMEEAVIITDDQWRILDFNEQASRQPSGINRRQLGTDCRTLLPTLDPALSSDAGAASLHTWQQDGRLYELKCQPLWQSPQILLGYLLLCRDTTERQSYLAQLHTHAQTDDLTGVLNRRALLQVMEQVLSAAWQASTPPALSMVLLDIDHFKQLNDQQGHQIGDLMLRQLTAQLQQSLQAYEHLGRYGGDEFVLILPGSDREQALVRMQALNQQVQQQLGISLSLGIADFQPHDTVRRWLYRADLALYQAKRSGRRQACLAEAPAGGLLPELAGFR